MAFSIDSTTYDKAKRNPLKPGQNVGHGYERRMGTAIKSLVVHSTENPRPPTTFQSEATYLYGSAGVSAHYLVGKQGQIVQFLDPALYVAWHAGTAVSGFTNTQSIGIELHHARGESWTDVQMQALTWLAQYLMARYAIPAEMIAKHAAIATPAGRKIDPTDWSDAQFYAWRASLTASGPVRYRARYSQAIFESPSPAGNIALNGHGILALGEIVLIDEIAHGGWAHLVDHRGFVPSGVLERLT